MAAHLSAAKCILLAVHFASEANIKALKAFTPSRPDALDPELVLRILSTYLPETVDPELYTDYVGEVVDPSPRPLGAPIDVDISPVEHVSEEQAQRRVKKIEIDNLSDGTPANVDLLARFICHRSYRIDNETGLLTLIPSLVAPFIDQSEYLRTWFISLVLPLLRLGYEYYPAHSGSDRETVSLGAFEKMDGAQCVHMLLDQAVHVGNGQGNIIGVGDGENTMARDLRGLVGPWMYGHTERKRRRLNQTSSNASDIESDKVKAGQDWEHVFKWMIHQAAQNFPDITDAIQEWDGPGDIDLGPYVAPGHVHLDEETQASLERQYAQVAFASCYAVEADSRETIEGAHSILVRLAYLLDFEPPPDLATSVQQLPKIDQDAQLLYASESSNLLEPEMLLLPNHPLTSPKMEHFMLLQMLVYTAYQLNSLGHSLSILNVAKLRFFSSEDDQLALLYKILHSLTAQGRRDEQRWLADHHRLMWLWHWNLDARDSALRGAGIFGKIDRVIFEKELLTVLVTSASYSLIDQLYLSEASFSRRRISSEETQQVILDQAMQLYDSASNGNRTRGSMKKASDLIAYALRVFPDSEPFRRASALLTATHSLSFYSLKLQHNVPFQPVNIRVSSDPLSLLPKVLEQNAKSYTNLDDMIGIGENLVAAGLPLRAAKNDPVIEPSQSELEKKSKLQMAERRVIAMCVEAALSEDDFETAYSYIVNRLTPSDGGASAVASAPISTVPQPQTPEDDISWRAAFLGGRYRPRDGIPPTLRRLEQRTELLSLSLLLAPPSNLSEILGVWRRCEEEASALLAAETAAEQSFDDRADRRNEVPGGFSDPNTEGMVFGQQRREVGRRMMGDEEAPVGLFELARGASRAFSRNAFPLRGSAAAAAAASTSGKRNQDSWASAAMDTSTESLLTPSSSSSRNGSLMEEGHQRTDSMGSAEGARVRRRDMLSSAVTGGLASGIGWVLGATPVDRNTSASGGGGGGDGSSGGASHDYN